MSGRRFWGRSALVTGAGGGIGRAVALALGEAGADVTLFGRREAALWETAELAGARGGGGRVRVVAGDVAHAEAVERAVRDGTVGSPIDLLVTCAGVNYPGPLVDAPDEKLSEMLTTNVLGTLVACRAVARRLLGVGRPGAIVCISSQMGSVGYPGRAPYCASKHAVNGLVKALALEWAAHPIRVNAVAPTFVETPLTASMLADAAFRRDVLARIPLGRVGTVEEVAGAVLYLLSDEASLITGHVLAVDGGWTAI